ncbi:MAG: hypothetical protein ACRDLS_01085, partial [Solirubrobacteraceae bacterium]
AGAIAGGSGGFAEAFAVDTSAATIDALRDAADAAASSPQAVAENWIKAYPCCLQTHGAIDAALAAGPAAQRSERITVIVHPLSRKAAALDGVADGLQAKFSIPYLTAYSLLHGAPDLDSFARVDPAASALATRVRVRIDPALALAEAVLEVDGTTAARVTAPLGSPANPLDREALAGKVRALAGGALDGALDDPDRPAATLLEMLLR